MQSNNTKDMPYCTEV